MVKKIHYTEDQFKRDLTDLTRQMARDEFKPDLIIGPARGGLIPAVLMSHYYDVKMVPIALSLRDFKTDLANLDINIDDIAKYKRILVVDDMVDSGETLDLLSKLFTEKLEKKFNDASYSNSVLEEMGSRLKTIGIPDIRYAVCFYNINNKAEFTPHYYAQEINKLGDDADNWYVFYWEQWWNPKK